MNRRITSIFAVFALLPLLISAVSADMGPKPSVNIEIRGISGSDNLLYYHSKALKC